jgi:[NiFe] hydrogenase diaphorase moiety large subunit
LKKQLDKIVEGHGSAGDVVALEELCRLVKNHSHCGLGQTAANPILTTLERYPEIYQSQLKKISYEPGFDLDGALETARRWQIAMMRAHLRRRQKIMVNNYH